MDPYKVLGISAKQVKHPSDLNMVRDRAKKLYKRFASEKKKFDGKKVLEAFDMIKAKLKNKPGEGAYKIIGRSRMERMMDKHFNHQTKEIKKNKQVVRELKKARKGEKRMRLPGDKENIPTVRRTLKRLRRRNRHRAKKRKVVVRMDVLDGLTRIGVALKSEAKFPKAIKLLHRWMKEYMNMDNREFAFEVLDELAGVEHLTEDSDSRLDVIQVFEYALGYFSGWFSQEETHRLLGQCWRISTILACHCFTDDAFTLSSTISKLLEALSLLEANRELLGDDIGIQDDGRHHFGDADGMRGPATPEPESMRGPSTPDPGAKAPGTPPAKPAEVPEPSPKGRAEDANDRKNGDGSPESPVGFDAAWSSASETDDEAEEGAATKKEEAKEERAGVKKEDKAKEENASVKEDDDDEGSVKSEAESDEEKANSEGKYEVKSDDSDGEVDSKIKARGRRDAVVALRAADRQARRQRRQARLMRRQGSMNSEVNSSAIDIDSDEGDKEEVIDSGSDDDDEVLELEMEVESESTDLDIIKEEMDLFSDESDDSSDDVDFIEEEAEEVDDIFKVPSAARSLQRIRENFVQRCLAKLFAARGPLWARSKVDALFQDVFYRRSIFADVQVAQIEAWQARIKVLQRAGDRAVGEANNPLEAHRPVVDAREMRVSLDADSNTWASKQTFDSRDRCGGAKFP